ncbi:MAG: hypothetical protein JKX85_03850 [Phycisphaeraceae bacterium]|nr:hypothetical protein [Phycisphaeraceae bacterium]
MAKTQTSPEGIWKLEGIIFCTIAGAIISLVVLVIVQSIRMEKKRNLLIEQLAETLGFDYTAKLRDVEKMPCSSGALFNRGRSRSAKNVMTGKVADVDVQLMDYQYTTGSGKHSTTHRMAVAAYKVPGLKIPNFALERENFLSRIADKFGFSDINFESHPKFSDAFQLKGKAKQAIRAFFTPALLTQIENGLIQKDWNVQAGGSWLIIYTTNGHIKPEELQTYLNRSFDLMNRLTAAVSA